MNMYEKYAAAGGGFARGTVTDMKDWWNKKYAVRAFYLFAALAAVIVFGLVLSNLGVITGAVGSFVHAISSFIIGFAIAYILNPSYTFFRKKVFAKLMPRAKEKVRKALSIAVLYILVLGIISVLIYLVVPQFIKSIVDCVNNLIANYDVYYATIDNFVTNLTGENGMLSGIMSNILDSLLKWLKSINPQDLLAITGVAGSVISSVFDIFIGVIISIYMLYNKEVFCAQIKKTGYAIFSKKAMYRLQKWFGTSHAAFGEYLTGVIIDAMIVGTTFGVLCTIFRVPYAPMIGVVLGLTNMIPFFGPYIGGIPCAVIVLVNDPWKVIVLVVMMLVVQQIDGNLIAPKIIGQKTGLAAIWVIFSILIGGAYFGVIGMLLGVPVFSVIYLFLRNFINERLEKKNMSSDTADYLASADVAHKYKSPDEE